MPFRLTVILCCAAALAGSSSIPSSVRTDAQPPASMAGQRPNIVLILTDDMRSEQLAWMPSVSSRLVRRGVTFDQGFVVNPLCCPSRASILTGKYSHGTDIYANAPPYGGWPTFNLKGEESSTIATWLHDAGYTTGLVGKYLNGYTEAQTTYVPPGWDTWDALTLRSDSSDDFYYNYSMSIGGLPVTYGAAPRDYATSVLGNYADSFIRSAPTDQPLFLYFAPTAPHSPATPPARYATACADVTLPRPPSFDEADVSDKPAYIQARNPLSAQGIARLSALYVNQCRALLGVDDAVAKILGALQDTGRIRTTLILFTSDNGVQSGEHRWNWKKVPYEESIKVPLVVRYDPLTHRTASVQHDLALNIDFAPTFAAAAGVGAPGAEGVNLLPSLDGSATDWRTDFLVEHSEGDSQVPVPPYCAVRSEHELYARYATGEEELYNLATDPYELDNLLVTQPQDPWVVAEHAALQQRATELCTPTPPGYTS